MGSLHNIDFGVFWASWGGSGKEPGSGNRFRVQFPEPFPGNRVADPRHCSGFKRLQARGFEGFGVRWVPRGKVLFPRFGRNRFWEPGSGNPSSGPRFRKLLCTSKVYSCTLKMCFCTLKVYCCTLKVFFCTLKVYLCTSKVYLCTLKV